MYGPFLAAPVKGAWAMLVVAVLAGCFGPPAIPDDASTDTDDQLPGLRLAAWTEERGSRVQLHAVASNDHDEGYWYRVNCGHPWNVTLTGPDGPVGFREVQEPAGCAPQFEILQPRQHIDSLWSWDLRDHDAESGQSQAVVDGAYTWRVAFEVRDHAQHLAASFIVSVVDGTLGNVTQA